MYQAVPASNKWNYTHFDVSHDVDSRSDPFSGKDYLGVENSTEIGVHAKLYTVAATARTNYSVNLLGGTFADVEVSLFGYRAHLFGAQTTYTSGMVGQGVRPMVTPSLGQPS
jgi:hypothetical protein